MAPYLTERALQGLKQYQYKPGGYTWLDAVHNPYWNCAPACSPNPHRPPLFPSAALGWRGRCGLLLVAGACCCVASWVKNNSFAACRK